MTTQTLSKRAALAWHLPLLVAAMLGVSTCYAVAPAALPKEAELTVTLSVQASSETGNAAGIALRVAREEWWVVGDRAELVARASQLRQELNAKYARPTTTAGFGLVSNEFRIANIKQFITADKELQTGQVSWRNLWTRSSEHGIWGGGLGAEALRLDSAPGLAPYLASYISQQGRTSHLLPVIGFWSRDRREQQILPNGNFSQLSVELGLPAFSAMNYAKIDFLHESYLRLGPRVAAGISLSAGRVVGSGGDVTPLTKRYFGGGVGSVRGYEAGALGPSDSSGAVTGANDRLSGSAELLWHALEIGATPVVFSAFYDRGRFSKADFAASNGTTASAYGVGISLPASIGLVRFSFAKPDNLALRTQRFQFDARASW